jgi:hypothetical protein
MSKLQGSAVWLTPAKVSNDGKGFDTEHSSSQLARGVPKDRIVFQDRDTGRQPRLLNRENRASLCGRCPGTPAPFVVVMKNQDSTKK